MSESKEKLANTGEELKNEVGLTEVLRHSEEAPPEIRRWIEKIEQDPSQQKIVNDINGQPLLQTITPVAPKIVLPVSRSKFVAGFKQKVNEAGKWLSTFVLRLIKIKGGKVKFEKE